MLDKTINNALLQLRAQIVRNGLDGLPHVDALLIVRGINPAMQHVPRKQPANRFKRSGLRILIMDSLRGGPVRSAVLIERVMQRQTELSREDASHRVQNTLWKMKVAGMVVRDGRMWGLTQ